jgi:hypothetical protein
VTARAIGDPGQSGGSEWFDAGGVMEQWDEEKVSFLSKEVLGVIVKEITWI